MIAYLTDHRTHEIVRRATREELQIAAKYPATLITYRWGDAWSHGRHGYLARLYLDEHGSECSIALTDDEIASLARGVS